MAGTITVSTSAELYQALANATGGETIQLAGGDYGKLAMGAYTGTNGTFPSNITITSADPLHPATFTGLNLNKASNVTIDGVVFDYTFKPGDPLYIAPFTVGGGDHITIRNSTFDGDVAYGDDPLNNGFGFGYGLTVRDTTNVTFEGNEMFSFFKGMVITESTDVNVVGNDLHSMRMDGMGYSAVQGINIEGNHIHDFRGSPDSADHRDMIQFWTLPGDRPSTDITIRNNFLDIGDGMFTQSIFMGNGVIDRGLAGPEMYYRNLTIEDNVIVNAQAHGISIGASANLVIRNNTVLHADGDKPDGGDTSLEIPRIEVSPLSTNVSVIGNVTPNIIGWSLQADWVVKLNAFVQDQNPGAPGYYGDVFISSTLTANDGVHAFVALPGSMIDLLGAGAAITRDVLVEPGTVAALFQANEDRTGSIQTRAFDGSLSLTDLGSLPPGTIFEWSFGDGTTATGMKVVHTFATGGHYDVALTVHLPTGVSDTVHGTVGVQDPEILSLGSDGAFRAHEYENTILLPAGSFGTAAGIQLGTKGVAVSVANEHIVEVLRAYDFDISVEMNADSITSSGEVFRLNSGIIASVNTKGELQVSAANTTGSKITLVSSGVSVTDLKSHSIDIRLEDGDMQLWIDGKMTSHVAFTGQLQSSAPFNLSFGNPWGGKNFLGDITAFNITVGENDFADAKTILSLGTDGRFHTTSSAYAPAMAAETMADEPGLYLGGPGLAASVAGSTLTDLTHTESFDVSMSLDADSADSSGLIFRIYETLASRVLATGQLVVRAFEADGSLVRLISSGTPFADLQSHDVDIRLQDGKLQLWIDSSLSAEAAFDGSLRDLGPVDLEFGSRYATRAFNGDLTAFDITVAGDSTWTSASAVVL